jgi:hypothetical protein
MSTLLLYGNYAALADLGGHGGAFALLTLPYLAISLWLLTSRALTSSAVEGGAPTADPKHNEDHHASGSG